MLICSNGHCHPLSGLACAASKTAEGVINPFMASSSSFKYYDEEEHCKALADWGEFACTGNENIARREATGAPYYIARGYSVANPAPPCVQYQFHVGTGVCSCTVTNDYGCALHQQRRFWLCTALSAETLLACLARLGSCRFVFGSALLHRLNSVSGNPPYHTQEWHLLTCTACTGLTQIKRTACYALHSLSTTPRAPCSALKLISRIS